MATVHVNGVQLYYQSHGHNQATPLLLIQGLGVPSVAWPRTLINTLVDKGYRVIEFDNRDIGKSTYLNHLKIPNLALFMLRKKIRLNPKSPYSLLDMMRDTEALLNHLKLEQVHILGMSMGGMIAQLLALHHPSRVSSLSLLATTSGNPQLPPAQPEVTQHLLSSPTDKSPHGILQHTIKTWALLSSPAYPMELENITEYTKQLLTHGMSKKGTLRQMLAILTAPGRQQALQLLNMPTLIIHGDSDPLLQLEHGQELAQIIPQAKLEIITGYGHDMPYSFMPKLSELIHQHISS